jgi:hypothetical protein
VSEAAVVKKEKPKGEKPKPGPPKTREQRAAEKQALAMWALLGTGGAAYGGTLKPPIEKAERAGMLQAGLVEAEKRERGALWLTVTDKGWDWAERHLGDPLPDKTFGGALVLQVWLARLQAFLRMRDIRLAELFVAQQEPSKPGHGIAAPPDHAELRERIRTAYLEVAGGFNRRALLSDLRAKLGNIDRSIIDEALEKMHFEDGTMLMTLDNPQEITPVVRAAELKLRGEPMHILWITK